jgi:tRNA1(Val) A37 N6-methylase TrmN6
METTLDAFLDGRITVEQPRTGYRAATDPVYLAASVKAKSGQTVLDVGCGVGVASLCLASRLPDLSVTGLEIQDQYALLARQNALRNEANFEVVIGDLTDMPKNLRNQSFDIVMTNPPYFDLGSGTRASDTGKATANSATITVAEWVRASLKRLRPSGWIYIIQKADQLPGILSGLNEGAGDIRIKPVASRQGHAANRVIVAARKGSKAPTQLLAPFVVHAGKTHSENSSDYAPLAQDVLRKGIALDL